jgi:thermitase
VPGSRTETFEYERRAQARSPTADPLKVRRTLTLAPLALALLLPQAAAAESTRIIVEREPGASAADVRRDAGVRLVERLPLPRTEVVRAANPGRALAELRSDDDVVYAQVDHVRTAFADPLMDDLWAFHNGPQFVGGVADADMDVLEAWQVATGTGQKVAVVDSGIEASHPDFAGQIADARNFVGASSPTAGAPDGDGHGTHVSGTIAAVRDNDVGVAGVAPGAKLMALRALDDTGEGFDSDIAQAMRYAGENGARVVNVSLGGPQQAPALQAAIAAHPNTLFVVAAGNEGTDNDTRPSYPCDVPEPNVLCVGASTHTEEAAPFSNYGDHSVDVFAPGQWIMSTVLGGTHNWESGTSMAAPHVSATAALVLEIAPALTAEEVKELILAAADPKPAFAGRSVSGGRANAANAVELALDGTTPPDRDGDGFADAADACPTVAAPGSPSGCPAVVDTDGDGVPDAADNCDVHGNPSQPDTDADGVGDACDGTPRGHDGDGDGKPSLDDRCPTLYGTGGDGCPVVSPPPPRDSDGDGRHDGIDACSAESAVTANGCPLPAVTSIKVAKTRKAATIRIGATRAATAKVTVKRRKCNSRGKRCRWVRVARKTLSAPTGRAKLVLRKPKRGRYRVRVQLSSAAGTAKARTKGFRVR